MKSNGALAAFARDTGPAADAIRELLEDPTPEKAKALLDRLPDDPALAAVIAEEMAKEFARFPGRAGEQARHKRERARK